MLTPTDRVVYSEKIETKALALKRSSGPYANQGLSGYTDYDSLLVPTGDTAVTTFNHTESYSL